MELNLKQERDGITIDALHIRRNENNRKKEKESGAKVVCKSANEYPPNTTS